MIESLIREAADRFGLGEKARPFVGLLLGLIFQQGGGFQSLRERFASAGLGDLFASWIGGQVPDNVLQPDQFSAAIGQDKVSAMASRLGIPNAAVTLAGATVLPKLIGLLTQGGHIPTTPPPEASALLGTANTHTASSLHHGAPTEHNTKGGGWLKWLIPLAIIVAVLMMMRGCKKEPEAITPPAGTAATATTPATPATQTTAKLGLEQANGKVAVSGQLPSAEEKTRLWDALVATFGAGNLSGDLTVDPATLPAGWLDKLITALPELKADGLKLGLDGERLSIDTSGMDDAQRHALSDRLRQYFGGMEITGLWDRAAAALAGLKSGFNADDLVKALNLMNVYFDTGSASITRDSLETLGNASKAIAQAPEGTRIEVGGHTDNTGDAAANQTLSQQRADAVVARLGELGVGSAQLSAKGYGQDKPRADNGTEDGKAQNRRIEFSVVP